MIKKVDKEITAQQQLVTELDRVEAVTHPAILTQAREINELTIEIGKHLRNVFDPQST